jgi:23S rRNA-intervening sequence protein
VPYGEFPYRGLLSTFSFLVNAIGFEFEKVVYQKSVAFADTVCSLTKIFPRGFLLLTDQPDCAAFSIVANMAEGDGHLELSQMEAL